ncbi:MAG TPA: ribonuclease H-like domain-containing protein [Segetibacter sp.]
MNNLPSIFDLLLIDIETVPQVSDFNKLSAGSQKLFVDKISKTVPEKAGEDEIYKQKAGILAEFGKVICISTGFFYYDKGGRICMKIKSIFGDDEADLLRQFIILANSFQTYKTKFVFAGHNIREFDIPFLCRRMIVNQIDLPPYLYMYGAKPWEVTMVDTMQWWKFGDYKNYTSLNLLASILGVPTSKDDIDGSMVQHVYYKENNLQRIVDYCEKDVIVAARVIQRLKNIPIIEQALIFKAG